MADTAEKAIWFRCALSVLLLLPYSGAWGASAEFAEGLAKVASGETAAALQLGQRLQRSGDPGRRREGGYLTARSLCLAGKAGDSLAILAALGPGPEPDAELELCRIGILTACDRTDDAIAAADALAAKGGVPAVRALGLLVDMRCQRSEWGAARRAVEFAANLLDRVDPSGVEQALRDQLARQRTRCSDGATMAAHGVGFILWREAQRQRRAGAVTAARATAERLLAQADRNRDTPWFAIAGPQDPRRDGQPIPSGYVFAAQLLVGECLLAEGRLDQAAAALEAVARDLDHPYAGEALRLLGDLHLEGRGDPHGAELAYGRALAWIAAVAGGERHPRSGEVPEASAQVVAPPPAMRRRSEWGRIAWNDPAPGQLFEPARCAWYLDYQRLTTSLRRALCRWQLGRIDEAVADLELITETDPLDAAATRCGMPSNFLRLRDGFRSGRLYITARELAAFRHPVRRMHLLLAELEFEQEHWVEAVAGYRSFLARFERVATAPELAYVRYALACARDAAGEGKAATAELTALRTTCRGTPTWARILIALSQDARAPQRALLEEVAADKTAPDEFRAEALYRLGQLDWLAGDREQARKRLSAVVALGDRAGQNAFVASSLLAVVDADARGRIPQGPSR